MRRLLGPVLCYSTGVAMAPTWTDAARVARTLVPPLSHAAHKGQMGRIAVLGGSLEYTGAPYYAAAATLKVGADLAWVFTAAEAATPIKSYSPELIVIPVYEAARFASADAAAREAEVARFVEGVRAWLPRLHALVIGPGLGRDAAALEGAARVVALARARALPIVIDADGLHLVTERPGVIAGYERAVLLPNEAEYARLRDAVLLPETAGAAPTPPAPPAAADAEAELKRVCAALGHVTVVRKGRVDLVSDGRQLLTCSEATPPRRCGGLGDILAGACGVLVNWASRADASLLPADGSGTPASPQLWAAWTACVLTKRSAKAAFAARRRSMTAPDVLDCVGPAFDEMFPLELDDM